MKTLVGGIIAAVLGIIGLSVWFVEFLQILAGAIPIMLLLGGALACYLGYDELKDSWKNENDTDTSFSSADTGDSEKLKQELADLKKENEELKKTSEEKASE